MHFDSYIYGMHMCITVPIWRSPFSPATLWSSGTELSLSGLHSRTAITQAPPYSLNVSKLWYLGFYVDIYVLVL